LETLDFGLVALVNGRAVPMRESHQAHKVRRRLNVSTAVAIDGRLGMGRNGRSVCDRLRLMLVTAVVAWPAGIITPVSVSLPGPALVWLTLRCRNDNANVVL
jgi:hypothetical protein